MDRSGGRALQEGTATRTPQGMPSPMNRKRMQRWILDRWLIILHWTGLMVKLAHDFDGSLTTGCFKINIAQVILLDSTTVSCRAANRLKPEDESNAEINRFHTPAEYKLIDTYRGWLYFKWVPGCSLGAYRQPGVGYKFLGARMYHRKLVRHGPWIFSRYDALL